MNYFDQMGRSSWPTTLLESVLLQVLLPLTYRSDASLEEEISRLCEAEPELVSESEGILQTHVTGGQEIVIII